MSLSQLRMKNALSFTAASVVALSLTVSSADAGTTVPSLEVILETEAGGFHVWNPGGQQTGDSQYYWAGEYGSSTGPWELGLEVWGDTDPWVNAVIGFTNNSGVGQIYTITVTLPVPAILGGTYMGGSVGGSVTWNGNGTGGILNYGNGAPGSALFFGQIDFANVLGLHFAPGGVAGLFQGDTQNIPAVSAGLPGPTIPGPDVFGTIGIQLQFWLSAGDSVAITSYFQVEPVPAPAALALLGLAGLTGRSRRRR